MEFIQALNNQPEYLAKSREAVVAQLEKLPQFDPAWTVVLVGIGASEQAAISAAIYYRSIGLKAISISASELMHHKTRFSDLFILISESGSSTEVLGAVDNVDLGRSVLLTNFAGSALGQVVSNIITLECGDDGIVYTVGFTSTLQALGIIGDHWAGITWDWQKVAGLVGDNIETYRETAQTFAEPLNNAAMIDVIGTRASVASAGEGALLLRETAHLRTAFYETYNYLHGPMEHLEPNCAAIVVGNGRERELRSYLRTLGISTIGISTAAEVGTDFRIPANLNPMAQTLLEIIPIQLMGYATARARGLDITSFRYKQADTKSSATGRRGHTFQ